MGKVIHLELCKKMKFNYTTKWYMNKPESFQENEMPKILWDFNTEMNHQTLARRPDLELIKKKKKRTCCLVYFAVPADIRVEIKENKKINKYLDLARELRKLWNMRMTVVVGVLGTVPKGLVPKGTVTMGNQEEESRSSKLQHCWDCPENSEESCWLD